MTELSTLQIRFNASLILGFAMVSLAALVLDRLTRGATNRRLFSVYRCLLYDPLRVRVALDFFLLCRVVRPLRPYMRFLFVGPELCLRLPSDSASRQTPLPLANASCYRARSGLSPPSCCPCRAHIGKSAAGIATIPAARLFFVTMNHD